MPGIFSWKNRILGRKTPEPERAVQVTVLRDTVVDRDLHNHTPRRSVRFNDNRSEFSQYNVPDWQNNYGEARVIGSLSSAAGVDKSEQPTTTDWQYADSYRMPMAPLASSELLDEETSGTRRFAAAPSRAGAVLQHLREQEELSRAALTLSSHEKFPRRVPVESQETSVHSSSTTEFFLGRGNSKAFCLDYFDIFDIFNNTIETANEHSDYAERTRPSSTLPTVGTRPITPVRSPTQSHFGGSPATMPRWEPNRTEHFHQNTNSEYSTPGRQLEQMNVVFLQANDEVKRAILPPEVHSLSQVKMAFVRAFPNISRHYIEQPTVKIYIQEQTKGQLFYELDDPSIIVITTCVLAAALLVYGWSYIRLYMRNLCLKIDIRNKSVLKLREHSITGLQSPVRFLDHPDYLSETENDDGRHRFVSLARPASAMAHSDYRKSSRKNYDSYDPYGSDTSSHDSRSVTRSGSATPIIDKESRARMESMERQLAGLSSLVHSALVSKGMSESSRRDMADLRREILALHPDSDRATSEEPSSLPDSISSHTQTQLDHLRQKLHQASLDMKQLRRSAQVNAQNARNYINEAGEEIARLISQKILRSPTSNEDKGYQGGTIGMKEAIGEERRNHEKRLSRLLEGLTKFENNVESVRNSVLTSNRKLRMSEVESLTEGLTQIGREAATLKTEFPPIQSAIEGQIKIDMERIVREEKYIRDQMAAVDQSLRRCKALANIMVTMKKLAMVQDPTIQRTKKETNPASSAPLGVSSIPVAAPPPPPPPPQPTAATEDSVHQIKNNPEPSFSANPIPQASNGSQSHAIAPSNTVLQTELHSTPSQPTMNGPQQNGHEIAAPYTPNISKNAPELLPSVPQQSNPSSITELDNVLEEVAPTGIPPRPPSRYSVQDVRMKFQKPPELPEQIKSLIDEVARRTSPAPDANERRLDLEERQERLAEKQRQLRSQFQQLQQMTPLP